MHVLDSKLNLLETFIQPEETWLNESQRNEKLDIKSFLASDIKLTNIKAVKFDFDKMSGGCMPFALYKENSKGLKVKNSESFSVLKNILSTYELYEKPVSQFFKFSEQDLADYFSYHNKLKALRQEEKVWGGDFTFLMNLENNLFLNPNKTIDTLSQQLLDTVYNIFSSNPFSFTDNEPYIIVNIVNNKSDTLKIKSESSNLYSLPWTVEYKNKIFKTYDTRITELLKATLPKGFNYYDNLLAGELIYRLIEQRVINEMTYKNGY